jgi:hypothetical protein
MHDLLQALARHPEMHQGLVSIRTLGTGFAPVAPLSLRTLLYQMRPFNPREDAFRFGNSDKGGWAITAEDAPAIKSRFLAAIDSQVADAMSMLRTALFALPVPLPAQVVEQLIDTTHDEFAQLVTDILIGVIPGRYGRCGGMAFAALDLFLAGWPVDERLGTTPPDSGPVRDFIFRRLLDSLEDNAGTFLQWSVELHLLPVLSRLATAALGAVAGSAGGVLGTALGGYLGSQVDVLRLGGEKLLVGKTAEQMHTLRARLDRFPAWPIGLVYGDKANPTDQHQILAIACKDDSGSGLLGLSVWDNNHGNREDFCQVDLRGDGLSVLGPSRPVKGIFCERYARAEPPPELHLAPR